MKPITKENSYKATPGGKIGKHVGAHGHAVNRWLYAFALFQSYKLDQGPAHVFYEGEFVCTIQRLQ